MNLIDSAVDQRTHTLQEILSQPLCWKECLRQLSDSTEFRQAIEMGANASEWMFVGCGSSYYLALAAAATFNHLGLVARAVPASELLLFPDITIGKGANCLPVLISRSGLTSEVLPPRACCARSEPHELWRSRVLTGSPGGSRNGHSETARRR